MICLLGLILPLAGCATELETSYGRSSPSYEQASVNGTDVLSGMFTAAGHTVAARRVLISSDLAKMDAIVWFPDDVAAPSRELCDWFNDWLAARPDRTLVYVGRDYDAAPAYWKKMLPKASQAQQAEYRKRLQMAKNDAKPGVNPEKDRVECDWFAIDVGSPKVISKLSGPWANGIDASKTEIELRDRFLSEPQTAEAKDEEAQNEESIDEELLISGDDVLVFRYTRPAWDHSQLIVVANGSFLLNEPLVNREHRKLAGELIDVVGPAGQVVFLSSGPGGPPIDPTDGELALWRFFAAWPLNIILLQLAVLGVIFCFARWPIFGRPRAEIAASPSDFARHVEAVGELMRRTHDRSYAMRKLSETASAAAVKKNTKTDKYQGTTDTK